MDTQQSKPPEIKPVVMKDDDRDKGGALGGLLSRLGLGGTAAGGAGGFGGALGGAGLGGGLLATKAGIVALVLVGTTVAGGIGMIGYKVFGPSASDRADARFSSLFEARPKPAPGTEGADGQNAAPKDGGSASLQYLAQANADAAGKDKKPEGGASGGAQAPVSASPASVGTAHDNNAAPVAKAGPALKSDMKIGGLTKLGGGGGGGGGSSASSGGAVPNSVIAGVQHGNTGGFGGGVKASANGGLQGIIRHGIKSTGLSDLRSVRKDLRNANSSQQAGSTYDNSRHGIASIQGPGGPDGSLGLGNSGKGPANPTLNPAGDQGRFASPPPPEGTEVTPWKSLIKFAQMMIAAAILLLILAHHLGAKPEGKNPISTTGAHVLAAIAAAIGLYVIMLGAKIGHGQWGQQSQGSMFTLAGGLIATSALVIAFNATLPDTGIWPWVFWISGALGVGAAIGGMLSKPKSFPSSDFKDGKPPDEKIIMNAPSEEVLFAYLPGGGADHHA